MRSQNNQYTGKSLNSLWTHKESAQMRGSNKSTHDGECPRHCRTQHGLREKRERGSRKRIQRWVGLYKAKVNIHMIWNFQETIPSSRLCNALLVSPDKLQVLSEVEFTLGQKERTLQVNLYYTINVLQQVSIYFLQM